MPDTQKSPDRCRQMHGAGATAGWSPHMRQRTEITRCGRPSAALQDLPFICLHSPFSKVTIRHSPTMTQGPVAQQRAAPAVFHKQGLAQTQAQFLPLLFPEAVESRRL